MQYWVVGVVQEQFEFLASKIAFFYPVIYLFIYLSIGNSLVLGTEEEKSSHSIYKLGSVLEFGERNV